MRGCRWHKTGLLFMALIAMIGCNRVPSGVIKPKKMAELMADVRMADAVVTLRQSEYSTEASKIALKNAVFERHGVTAADFDSSLVWYGHNIKQYQEVTEESIEILEKRLKEADRLAAGEMAMSISGDSVDIWTLPRVLTFSTNSPSEYLGFAFETDQNWEKGDVYTLRSRALTPMKEARWNLVAVYDDGGIETITNTISLDNPERQELTLITDSTKTAVSLSGWINVVPEPGHLAVLDSLSLMRRRTSPALASKRKYIQKFISAPKNAPTDSVSE